MHAGDAECQSKPKNSYKVGYFYQSGGMQDGHNCFAEDGSSTTCPADESEICGVYGTPISLEWGNIPNKELHISATQFVLDKEQPEGKWYRWYASDVHPLLVYDPGASGEINSPEQLFGSYTFGNIWTNGYEALATLDKDGDSKISGAELKDLALWFDYNYDGISQEGEVVKIEEKGVQALFFSGYQRAGNNLEMNVGYERVNEQDEIVYGRSLDWFVTDAYDSREEALLDTSLMKAMGGF